MRRSARTDLRKGSCTASPGVRGRQVRKDARAVEWLDGPSCDLDEDGLVDPAVANRETDHVTLLSGIAGGGFERRDHSRFRVDVSPHPHAVRLHDIDSDGHADLLVDDRSPESIRLFRGRGDGTFSGATSIDVGGDPYRDMSLADVTGDGLADLITPNPDHVAVLVGGEDGGFRPRATLSAPFGPFSVVAADLNGQFRARSWTKVPLLPSCSTSNCHHG